MCGVGIVGSRSDIKMDRFVVLCVILSRYATLFTSFFFADRFCNVGTRFCIMITVICLGNGAF